MPKRVYLLSIGPYGISSTELLVSHNSSTIRPFYDLSLCPLFMRYLSLYYGFSDWLVFWKSCQDVELLEVVLFRPPSLLF